MVVVGYGTVGRMHVVQHTLNGVKVLGVVEPHTALHADIAADGLVLLPGIEAARRVNPDLWDVCVPTSGHIDVIDSISFVDPCARILVEKPVCHPEDAERLAAVLVRHQGKIVVNENYASSTITSCLRDMIEELQVTPTRLIVDMSKQRQPDVLQGRFIDTVLHATGYEGPHLVTVAEDLLGEDANWSVLGAWIRDHAGFAPGDLRGTRQGGALIRCVTESGCVLDLHTALDGQLHEPGPSSSPHLCTWHTGPSNRHRIARVDGMRPNGEPVTLVGWYAPLPWAQDNRTRGAVGVFREGVNTPHLQEISDNSLGAHLRRAVSHFTADLPDPYPVDRSLRCLRFLESWLSSALGLVEAS
ncbi:Gfo/Idh/MocA family oxidoreductase [Streptomyces sp. NPDC015127]|uniref:Gfo/Idh/MocA family oxidoreductase n=1 Tax=Streptomyces sp. NPDC015127 TaxID=3364939 RepID=UPI0036FBCDBD